jgi:hypothetical protein
LGRVWNNNEAERIKTAQLDLQATILDALGGCGSSKLMLGSPSALEVVQVIKDLIWILTTSFSVDGPLVDVFYPVRANTDFKNGCTFSGAGVFARTRVLELMAVLLCKEDELKLAAGYRSELFVSMFARLPSLAREEVLTRIQLWPELLRSRVVDAHKTWTDARAATEARQAEKLAASAAARAKRLQEKLAAREVRKRASEARQAEKMAASAAARDKRLQEKLAAREVRKPASEARQAEKMAASAAARAKRLHEKLEDPAARRPATEARQSEKVADSAAARAEHRQQMPSARGELRRERELDNFDKEMRRRLRKKAERSDVRLLTYDIDQQTLIERIIAEFGALYERSSSGAFALTKQSR